MWEKKIKLVCIFTFTIYFTLCFQFYMKNEQMRLASGSFMNNIYLEENLEVGNEEDILQILHARTDKVANSCRHSVNIPKARYNVRWLQFMIRKSKDFIIIMPDKKLIWCMVPKVASTSIANAILRTNQQSSNSVNSLQPQEFLRKTYRNSVHLHTETAQLFLSFYITRHPFERIVSAYRNKFENSTTHDWNYFYEIYGKKIILQFRKVGSEQDTDLKDNPGRKEPTFREFIKSLLTTNVRKYDPHWMPISQLCEVCALKYDYILRFENFQKEFTALQRVIKKEKMVSEEFEVQWENKGVQDQDERINVTKMYMNKLPPNDIESLQAIFKSDFDYFDYNPSDYL